MNNTYETSDPLCFLQSPLRILEDFLKLTSCTTTSRVWTITLGRAYAKLRPYIATYSVYIIYAIRGAREAGAVRISLTYIRAAVAAAIGCIIAVT